MQKGLACKREITYSVSVNTAMLDNVEASGFCFADLVQPHGGEVKQRPEAFCFTADRQGASLGSFVMTGRAASIQRSDAGCPQCRTMDESLQGSRKRLVFTEFLGLS